VDPFGILLVAAAAGFVFSAFRGKTKPPPTTQERSYSRDTVVTKKKPSRPAQAVSEIEVLPEYKLVRDLIAQKFPLIFVTGGAGTGKSTFIRWLVHEFEGTVLLAAPTGMAAINIEGKTIHSLCQLPPAWILKQDIKRVPRRREIKEAKLLVIDEISMVTANLLDGVSGFFRLNRGVDEPFGGLPVIMVGDLFQLPPVVTKETRELFERTYGSARFYNAKCLKETTFYAIELTKAFRQVDQAYVNLLAKIREGVELPENVAAMNKECRITNAPPDGAVWLCPRNAEVDQRNLRELEKIGAPAKMYRGRIEGQFKTDRLPSPMELELKPGAQVMFTKNDPQKRWVNGSVGIVTKCMDGKVFVKSAEFEGEEEVGPMKWPEYQYRWNDVSSEIEREETGSYTQIPLVLAWSITIHKSQGKTIEKVHLDLGAGAFDTGQTYVALSRCRALAGLTLARPLSPTDVLVDQEAVAFYEQLRAVIKKLPPDQMAKKLNEGSGPSM
jgi:ATP-dependent DNA helicase PIF1